MNPGDGFLTEEWSYPSALSLAKPYNINPVSVAMDGDGMRPDILRKTLSEWDESARGGMKRFVAANTSIFHLTEAIWPDLASFTPCLSARTLAGRCVCTQ